MEPLSKFILKMQHFASRNTALGQFSCRLDSAGGGEYLGQERFSRNHLGVRTAFVSRGLRIMVITDDRWLYITCRHLKSIVSNDKTLTNMKTIRAGNMAYDGSHDKGTHWNSQASNWDIVP